MVTFNSEQCYFGHAYSYCAATLEIPMTVCSMVSGNLKAIAVESEVFAAWIITENKDSSVIMTTNIISHYKYNIPHTITFLFNFGGGTGIGFVGSTNRCPSSPPCSLNTVYYSLITVLGFYFHDP